MENPSRHMDWRKLVSYLQVASLWVLIVAIPFRMGPFPLWAMIAAGALFLLEYAVDRRWRTWRWERDKWLYVAMIAFYLFIPIWQIWSDTLTWRFSFVLGERLPLALCGIIGLLGFSGRVRLRHACYAFITGCVLTSLYIISGSGGLAFFAHGLKEQSELFHAGAHTAGELAHDVQPLPERQPDIRPVPAPAKGRGTPGADTGHRRLLVDVLPALHHRGAHRAFHRAADRRNVFAGLCVPPQRQVACRPHSGVRPPARRWWC